MNTAASVQPDWKWATWDGSRQLDQKLTFHEKLEWLEQTETAALFARVVRCSQDLENSLTRTAKSNRKTRRRRNFSGG